MEERLKTLEASVKRIEQALERIESNLNATQKSCENMDGHIEFVESVYTTLRKPLSYISSRFRADPLPTIECKPTSMKTT